ncbi:hypothetical protein Pfo_015731 [Paulownia fortunei]|nr:hypothetical protein Pfo_015731 [Paulownia fortunei]
MVDSYVNSLPAQIFELFHLRYLAFNYPLEIPAAISNLQNLQTLFIHPRRYSEPRVNEPGMVYLSSEIWKMPQLRLLVCYSFGPLPDPEGATFALENLQTLSVANFKCTERILKMIPNLKQLGIFYTKERYGRDNHLYNLVYLPQLENLKVEINPTYLFQPKLPVFPTTLKKLTLRGWKLPWKDMMIIGSLPNLQVLKLKYSLGKDEEANWETSDGGFPQLKFLLIDRTNIRHWITESSHFPSLMCLLLHDCWRLREIPDGIGEIPTLELIEVKGKNKSLMDSAKRIQEEQQSFGNDALQVRCMRFDQNFADSDDSDDELDD